MKNVNDLIGKNIVVYDLEIKNIIDGKNITWNDKHLMGISVGCAFDYREMRYRVFLDDNIGELVDRLNEPETLIVAFNQEQFDNELLRQDPIAKLKTSLLPDDQLKNYDMYKKSKEAKNAGKFDKGFRLQEHLTAMKLSLKTADGSMAPVWWQEGKIGKCIDYCLNDVSVERGLFEHIYVHAQMACAAFPELYDVEVPVL
jgi:hypothetical protein